MESRKNNAVEYHGHPNYFMIFVALLVMLGVSLLCAYLPNHKLAIALIFILAVAKAYLVVGFFMHLSYEKWVIVALPGLAVALAIILFWGVYPDITIVKLFQAQL